MAGSVNKVILVGNLGKDPEVRTNQQGQKIVTFRLATSDTWNDRQSGERQERTEWHRIVIFNERSADVAERFLRKGRKVYIEGKLQTRKWTGQDGKDNYTTEIVLPRFGGELTILDTRHNEEDGQGGSPSRGNTGSSNSGGWDEPGGRSDLDDEIPF
ncbi:single-strand DNA binding protein Ssb [Acetobacter nitrogenifigens DSM 23921 = NBRC 105050]|uniref:Single-stranded DNA-binding protein n=1 Tax=Acetobacter nitrogenifigens DSM 23921 = NBRC 105050 TaxID=1120919 RepID=A0A511XEW7_9PROT|nr:single-stranded DNA-binding protein [Acetobacter nitrogenifigens]GBQ96722.1 single-strand DNA binding protein Ssb [Acetobacter nitrogenifigens DSM 23921 = NBRC 105050]GEN61500.1 single-stranded DNA-binding protein [Acetobacter nitrogenifigens DSM 23921 = NBRC 105050]